MFEQSTFFLLGFFSILFLIAPFIVNAFYQRRAVRFFDDVSAGDIDEYNRQIRANALILLVRRSLWGLFIFSGVFWNFRLVWQKGFQWSVLFVLIAGISCCAFGIWGYRNELKRVKTLE